MSTPYYHDAAADITVYHANCLDVLPTLAARSVDLVLTDPPYAEETHSGARTHAKEGKPSKATGKRRLIGKPEKLISFDSMSGQQIRDAFGALGRVANGWVVSTVDWRHASDLERRPPDWLRFVRLGVWVKPNGMPQISGDRPGTGWEAIVHLHRLGGRMRWNGGGRNAVYTHNIETRGNYPSAKPESLIAELMLLFSNPGDLVLDAFCGGGTTLWVAKQLGRRAIGIDISEEACEKTVRRLEQHVLDLSAVSVAAPTQAKFALEETTL